MTAYIIAEVDVHSPEQFERYRAMVPETLKPFGGRYRVRGGEIRSLEGNWNPPRVVVLEFESLDQALEWHGSDTYREARTLRNETAHSRIIAVDGVD